METPARSLGQMVLYMGSMIGILVFINWASSRGGSAVWDAIYAAKWWISGAFALVLAYTVVTWFNKEERADWLIATRDFALQILPLLFGGVLVAGFLLGRPWARRSYSHRWIAGLLGGNSLFANFFAPLPAPSCTCHPDGDSYRSGASRAAWGGACLALLLAGPSLSLPPYWS
jgi:uncharacterized membrane protein YraQ (UPF0718 family)